MSRIGLRTASFMTWDHAVSYASRIAVRTGKRRRVFSEKVHGLPVWHVIEVGA